MICREAVEFLADYLDGALPEATRAEFEAHLAECSMCRAYLATYGETIRAARNAEAIDEQFPPELRDAIVATIGKRP